MKIMWLCLKYHEHYIICVLNKSKHLIYIVDRVWYETILILLNTDRFHRSISISKFKLKCTFIIASAFKLSGNSLLYINWKDPAICLFFKYSCSILSTMYCSLQM